MSEECMTAVEQWMKDISVGIDKIKDNLQHVMHVQGEQASEIATIRVESRRAADVANEAKRMADETRCEMANTSTAMIKHVGVVESSLKEHDAKLNTACNTLYEQDDVLSKQTDILNKLRDSDLVRTATEKEHEKILKGNWAFLKWALPLSVTTVTAVITAVVWFMVHYPILK